MTIRIQSPSVADWILSLLGKKRAVLMPATAGRYGIYIARRENFFRALFRTRNELPPNGWIYWEENIERANDLNDATKGRALMKVHKACRIFAVIIIPMFLFIACDKVFELINTTTKVVKEQVAKGQQQVTVQAVELTDSAKRFAEDQFDKTQQQLAALVSTVTEKVFTQTKNWIYETLKPFFPWIFIIFFLLLFAALKAIIPFSNIFLIQLPLVVSSYIISFWMFAKLGLSSFALAGTFWLFIPIAITAIIVYLGRNHIKPKILALNSKIVIALAGKSAE